MSFDTYLKTATDTPKLGAGGLLDEVPFPVDVFPARLHKIITEGSKVIHAEKSHLGTGVLGAFSLAIGNTLRVKVVNHRKDIPAHTWMLLVESSGGGKGQAQDFAFSPIQQMDEEWRIKQRNYENDLKKQLWQLRKDKGEAIDKEKKNELQTQINGLQSELDNIESRYLLITDITMESVRTANLQNRRGLGYVRDELSGFYNSFGRYSKGGNATAEEAAYIELYDGKPIIPFRNSKAAVCDYPFTTIFGGTQNGALGDLGKNNRMVSGFIFRFLISIVSNKPVPEISEEDLMENPRVNELIKEYDLILRRVFTIQMAYKDDAETIPDPKILVFDKEARKEYVKYQNSNAKFANTVNVDENTREVIRSITGRSNMNLFRLCLIMEAIKWACGESSLEFISGDTVRRCSKLMEYYRYTMLKVYAEVESIRFEAGSKRPKRTQFDYKKIFGKRDELTRSELYERLHNTYGVSFGTAEKYVLEDEKLMVPPILSTKDGRNKIYHLNDIKK